jgi:hypothetical protein
MNRKRIKEKNSEVKNNDSQRHLCAALRTNNNVKKFSGFVQQLSDYYYYHRGNSGRGESLWCSSGTEVFIRTPRNSTIGAKADEKCASLPETGARMAS